MPVENDGSQSRRAGISLPLTLWVKAAHRLQSLVTPEIEAKFAEVFGNGGSKPGVASATARQRQADVEQQECVGSAPRTIRLAAIRRSRERGVPYGGEAWVVRTARALGLESTQRPPGRPKKQHRAKRMRICFDPCCSFAAVPPAAAAPHFNIIAALPAPECSGA